MPFLTLALTLSAGFTSLPANASASKKPATAPTTPKTGAQVEREYLVSFEPGVNAEDRHALLAAQGLKELERVGSSELYLVQFPEGANAQATMEKLKHSPGVRYVEPNLKMRLFKDPAAK
ncbi:MAG: hypothetical protein JST16_13805 [Bdellovibrionales bacterium]|nr:hypothetical protein [Bdellovibrionales bacterium]